MNEKEVGVSTFFVLNLLQFRVKQAASLGTKHLFIHVSCVFGCRV